METSAFKLYDLRGKYPEEVNEHLAFALGKALSSWKAPKRVAIAGDIRESTPKLKKYLIDGFSEDVEVFDLGEVPVPEFYYTVAKKGFDLGVMVTASHLGAKDNGFKIVGKDALPLDQGEILKLKKIVAKETFPKIVVPTKKVQKLDMTKDYVDDLKKMSQLKSINMNLVLDTIRSSTSTVVPALFKDLKAKFTFTRKDHEGNPLMAENRRELESSVKVLRAGLGIMWDSDGDRVAFIDKSGNFIPVSFVLAILGSSEVKKNGGGKVAIDVRAGLVVRDEVELSGGTVEVFPAWHTSLKFAMADDPKIIFAGENSGHIIYKDFYSIDDGIFVALKFIDYCQKNDLEEKLKHLKNRYFELPEINYKVSIEKSAEILENVANIYRKNGNQVSLIDGLTVFGSDWKFNLRSSATEPLLRLNLEAGNKNAASKIMATLEEHLEG